MQDEYVVLLALAIRIASLTPPHTTHPSPIPKCERRARAYMCLYVCVCVAATKRACGKCLSNKYEMVSGIIISCSAASRCLADKATRTERAASKKKKNYAQRERDRKREG